MKLKTQITYINSPEVIKKNFKDYLKESLTLAVFEWQEKIIPKHFTWQGAYEYGYKQRTEKYRKRKSRQKGQTNPLVWTGNTRQTLTTRVAVTSMSKSASGKIIAPWYIKAGSGKGKPNMLQELESTSEKDAQYLAEFVDKKIKEKIENNKTKEVKEFQ